MADFYELIHDDARARRCSFTSGEGHQLPLPECDYYQRLRRGSAAVDKGKVLANVTDGFAGAAPDIGAYELGPEQ